MTAFDPTMKRIGNALEISYTTTAAPIREYIENMKKHVESFPDEKFFFADVRFLSVRELTEVDISKENR